MRIDQEQKLQVRGGLETIIMNSIITSNTHEIDSHGIWIINWIRIISYDKVAVIKVYFP